MVGDILGGICVRMSLSKELDAIARRKGMDCESFECSRAVWILNYIVIIADGAPFKA